MLVSKKIRSYNGRRYGQPWVARITAFNNGQATLAFINRAYNGTDDGGKLVFEAHAGEVVKIGQSVRFKAYRKTSSSENSFFVVSEDGKLLRIEDPVEARQLWLRFETWLQKESIYGMFLQGHK